ncbi:unnamed protein product [Oppiella nova]|uniref:Uncharacterized protein n=1 Tax=Oppiella nova TaxID=334625 RepID=A0A7R9L852_9ACAR|nr:unnamed protein product [Oppiella nova]CAG2158698.1 unnamed protein product [Oppiella nova]
MKESTEGEIDIRFVRNRKRNAVPNKPTFTDVSHAYDYLRTLFPIQKFNQRIPTIVWKHQLYPLLKNKTLIDRQLNSWCESAYIRLFRLGSTIDNHEVVIVLMSDFQEFADKCCRKTIITERFLKKVIIEKSSTQISCDVLKNEYQFNDDNISELIRCGLLARHRSSGVLLISLPNAGEFVKAFDFGKKFLISIIKKSKYKEILKSELMKRRVPKDMKFDIEYHLYDLIGSEVIQT